MSATPPREPRHAVAEPGGRLRARAWLEDAGAALVLAAVLWLAIEVGIIETSKGDVFLFRDWGEAIAAGAAPYRDVAIEYPPGALPLFVAPAAVTSSDFPYYAVFAALMMCAAAALLVVTRRLAPERRVAPLIVAVLILLLGSVAVTRFDLVPAALLALSLLMFVRGRHRLGGLTLGTAAAVKLYPLVVLPLVVVYVAQRAGARAAGVVAGLALGVVALAFLPFVLLSPGSVDDSLSIQLTRPLQIESLGGVLFAAGHRAFGIHLAEQTTYYDLPEHTADVIARVSTLIGVAIIVALWVVYARRRATSEGLVRYAAAVLAAYVAFGKVLSPQYLLWLVAIVPLVVGWRGRIATGLLALACLLTAVVFPRLFDPELLVRLSAEPLVLLVIRDLLIVVICVVLAWPAPARERLGDELRVERAWPAAE